MIGRILFDEVERQANLCFLKIQSFLHITFIEGPNIPLSTGLHQMFLWALKVSGSKAYNNEALSDLRTIFSNQILNADVKIVGVGRSVVREFKRLTAVISLSFSTACLSFWRSTDGDKCPDCTWDKPFSCFFSLFCGRCITISFPPLSLVSSKPNRSLRTPYS